MVAWRRRWVAFWWRTSLDGGKPRRGGKSSRGSLTSHHSSKLGGDDSQCQKLRLGNHGLAGSARLFPRRSLGSMGYEAEPRNRAGQGVRGSAISAAISSKAASRSNQSMFSPQGGLA